MTSIDELFPENAINELTNQFFQAAQKIANDEPKIQTAGHATSFLLTAVLRIANESFCKSAEILEVTPELLRQKFIDTLQEAMYEEDTSSTH